MKTSNLIAIAATECTPPSADVGPVFLFGTDYEGDSREEWHKTQKEAERIARQCADNSDGFGWGAWEIWANHPETQEWVCVASWKKLASG